MRLIHFSDLHLWRLGWEGDLYPKRLLGLGNLLLRRRWQFPPVVQDRLLAKILAESADAVLFTGDLTTTALPSEFDMGARSFRPLLEKWGERFIAIPGNHDRYTPTAVSRRWFETRFLQSEQSYPFVKTLSDELSVVGVDVGCPRLLSSRGRIEEEQLSRLAALLSDETDAGRQVIVLGHYPLRLPAGARSSRNHGMDGGERLRELVDRAPAIAYLHGHRHERQAVRGEHALFVNAGSAGKLSRRPNEGPGYLRLSVEAGRIAELTAVRLESAPGLKWEERPLELP